VDRKRTGERRMRAPVFCDQWGIKTTTTTKYRGSSLRSE
jgi:hypothetical protein